MNYRLKFTGVVWSESGFVSGGGLTCSWAQWGLWRVSHPPRWRELKPSAETRGLQDKCPRLCTETAPRTGAGQRAALDPAGATKGWAGGRFLPQFLTLASFPKCQAAVLVEISQKADYLFLLLLLERRGRKRKARNCQSWGKSLGQQPKGWRDITSLLLVWCVYVNFVAYTKCIHTSPELPDSLPSHAELGAASSNFSHARLPRSQIHSKGL